MSSTKSKSPITRKVKQQSKKAEVKSTTPVASTEMKPASPVKVMKVNTKLITVLIWVSTIFVSFLLIDLLIQYLNNDYSVAVVNGSRVTQSEFNARLEETYGASIIQSLIDEEIITIKAKQEDIKIDDAEVDEVIEEAKKELGSDEKYQEALEENNLTEDRYRERIETRLLAQKLVVEEPSDEELEAYFDGIKEIYFEEDDTFEDVKDAVEKNYYSQKYSENAEQWLAEAREDAEVQNNIETQPRYGFFKITRNVVSKIFNR